MIMKRRIRGRITTSRKVRKALKEKYNFYGTWADVANELEMNKGYLSAVAQGKKRPSYRLYWLLGMTKRNYHDLWEMPSSILAWKLRNREVI